jgi:hypothetical protein
MNLRKLAALGAALVLILAVVAGQLLRSPPENQALGDMDALRRAALQELAAVISRHYEENGTLPARIADLVDGRNLQVLPTDPVSGQTYDYEPEADDSYALCASFDGASQEGAVAEFWMHRAGRSCFRLSPAYGEF